MIAQGLDLAAIEARANAATRGPWGVEQSPNDLYSALVVGTALDPGAPELAACLTRADAEFIAAARTDVPQLVAEVRRLESALANANAVAADRIADRDKICRDLMAERDEAREEAKQLRAAVDRVQWLTKDTDGDDLDPDFEITAGDIRAALDGQA